MDALTLIASEPLSSASPTPLFRQLKHRILQVIATGALGEDAPLPAEEAIAHELGLSRATVRRCFKDLVNEGYVVRKRGQGTFVRTPAEHGGLDTLYAQVSTSSSIERSGALATSRFLGLTQVEAAGGIARSLAVSEGTPLWEINRLRLANGEPVVHELAYLRCETCPELDQADLEHKSLYQCVAEASGALPARTEERIEAIALDAREARLLESRAGLPALRILACSLDTQGEPFETSVGVARADRFRLEAAYTGAGTMLRKVV